MTKVTECYKCKQFFKNCNFNRHFNTCDGEIKRTTNKSCPHCNISYENMSLSQIGNHTRWCKFNPKLDENKKKIKGDFGDIVRKIALESKHKSGFYNKSSKEKQLGLPLTPSPLKGKPNLTWRGSKHSDETKELIRKKALESKHRRLVKSIRRYIKADGTEILLDSSWEEKLAIRLDYLNIKWIRPGEPIIWIDNKNRNRKYFPDFYLPEYDLFLDPKNPEATRQQSEKIAWLKENVTNIIILSSEEQCETFIL